MPEYNAGDTSFILVCTFCVFLMIPGLGFLYSGLARRKSALSMIWLTISAACVALFQWYIWGFSLALSSHATNKFIGDLKHAALTNMLNDPPNANIPLLLTSSYQGMFCALTCAILMGGYAERGRLFPAMVFVFFWATAVYCPLAYWAWGKNGWAQTWGVLDYAGGGPVEIGSGVGGIAFALVVGRRKEKLLLNFRPHNVSMVTLGTILLWFGWLGFNGGSAVGANLRGVYAVWNSNICAAFGAMSWCLMDWRLERKWSMVAICSGIISGLVAATPSSGCIPFWASVILGIVSGILCNLSTQIKYFLHIDDSMDTLAEHGIAGIIGLIFNALFGVDWVIGLDGKTDHPGGWLSHHWKQIYKQIIYVLVCIGWTALITVMLAYIIDFIPGCKMRVSEDAEVRGIDEDQIGEFAYDYVEVRRDYLSWALPKESNDGQAPMAPPPELTAQISAKLEQESRSLESGDVPQEYQTRMTEDESTRTS